MFGYFEDEDVEEAEPSNAVRPLFLLARGQPDALQHEGENEEKQMGNNFTVVDESHLLWERNFPVEWPEPSQPGMGHLRTLEP